MSGDSSSGVGMALAGRPPERSRSMAGPLLFARYAYPPNALGHCGPADSRALLEYAASGTGDRGLVELARRFEGAWPYLTLIAAANGRADPLDPAVVEAYWLGSPLLERVPPDLLAAHLADRFDRRLGYRQVVELGTVAAMGGRAHHNFHVFAVYPWVGLLRAGPATEPLRVLDSCRVRWGWVEWVEDGWAGVRSRPLSWDGYRLRLGRPAVGRATLAVDGYALAERVRPGDPVALHWDWVCQVLRPAQLRALRHYTLHQLAVVNGALSGPVPGLVLD